MQGNRATRPTGVVGCAAGIFDRFAKQCHRGVKPQIFAAQTAIFGGGASRPSHPLRGSSPIGRAEKLDLPSVTAEFYINKQTACHPDRQAVPAPNSRPHTVRYANAHRESIRLCVILSVAEIFVGEARRAEKIEERQRRRDLVTSLVGLSRCCFILVFTTLPSAFGCHLPLHRGGYG